MARSGTRKHRQGLRTGLGTARGGRILGHCLGLGRWRFRLSDHSREVFGTEYRHPVRENAPPERKFRVRAIVRHVRKRFHELREPPGIEDIHATQHGWIAQPGKPLAEVGRFEETRDDAFQTFPALVKRFLAADTVESREIRPPPQRGVRKDFRERFHDHGQIRHRSGRQPEADHAPFADVFLTERQEFLGIEIDRACAPQGRSGVDGYHVVDVIRHEKEIAAVSGVQMDSGIGNDGPGILVKEPGGVEDVGLYINGVNPSAQPRERPR